MKVVWLANQLKASVRILSENGQLTTKFGALVDWDVKCERSVGNGHTYVHLPCWLN